jgi:hypothetical protein
MMVVTFWVIAMEFCRSGGNKASFFASQGMFYYGCWCWTGCVYCYWGVKASFTRYAGVDWFSTVCLVNKGDVSVWHECYYWARDYSRV